MVESYGGEVHNQGWPEWDSIISGVEVSTVEFDEAGEDRAHALKGPSFELLQTCSIRGCALCENAHRVVLLVVILDGTLTILDLLDNSIFGRFIITSEDEQTLEAFTAQPKQWHINQFIFRGETWMQ